MPLITIVLVLIVVGVLLWLINTYIPMDRKIKNILNIVVVLCVVFWLASAFGLRKLDAAGRRKVQRRHAEGWSGR